MKTIYNGCKSYEVRMVDVRVLKNNEKYAIVAEHKNDHAVSLEDLKEKIFFRHGIELEMEGSEIEDPSYIL